MNRIKQLALSSVVMTLAVSGFAYAQTATTPTPPTPPAATTGQAPAVTQDDDAAMDQSDDLGDDMDAPDADMEMPDAGMDARGGDMSDDAPADAAATPDKPQAGMPGRDGMERPGRRGGPMGWLDTDKDGAIAKDEFQGRRLARLAAADTDGDGTLSQPELEAMVLKQIAERRARQLTKRLDINGDGKVTLAEIESMRDKRFAVMDRNDDGKIDARELAEVHRGMGPKHGMQRGGRDGMQGKHHGRHGERHGRHGGEGMRDGDGGHRMMPGGERDRY